MKYLKSIFESLSEKNRMVAATYKNAIINNKKELFDDVKRKYGINKDILEDIINYCIYKLDDLDTLRNLIRFETGNITEDLEGLDLTLDEFLEDLFADENQYFWNVSGVMYISKKESERMFKVHFRDDFEDDFEQEDMAYIDHLIDKSPYPLETGIYMNSFDLEDGTKLLKFFFKESKTDSEIWFENGDSFEEIIIRKYFKNNI